MALVKKCHGTGIKRPTPNHLEERIRTMERVDIETYNQANQHLTHRLKQLGLSRGHF